MIKFIKLLVQSVLRTSCLNCHSPILVKDFLHSRNTGSISLCVSVGFGFFQHQQGCHFHYSDRSLDSTSGQQDIKRTTPNLTTKQMPTSQFSTNNREVACAQSHLAMTFPSWSVLLPEYTQHTLVSGTSDPLHTPPMLLAWQIEVRTVVVSHL